MPCCSSGCFKLTIIKSVKTWKPPSYLSSSFLSPPTLQGNPPPAQRPRLRPLAQKEVSPLPGVSQPNHEMIADRITDYRQELSHSDGTSEGRWKAEEDMQNCRRIEVPGRVSHTQQSQRIFLWCWNSGKTAASMLYCLWTNCGSAPNREAIALLD